MHKQLVKRDKKLLPPLRIKIGLFKKFVKALDKESSTHAYLAEKYPSLSQAKIKDGIFIGHYIRKIVLDETAIKHLKRKEKIAFDTFRKFVSNHCSTIDHLRTFWATIVQKTTCKLWMVCWVIIIIWDVT